MIGIRTYTCANTTYSGKGSGYQPSDHTSLNILSAYCSVGGIGVPSDRCLVRRYKLVVGVVKVLLRTDAVVQFLVVMWLGVIGNV